MGGLHTGQRLGDVLAMHRDHIQDGGIHVVQQKTKKELWVPIHPDLKPIIDEADGYLFPAASGKLFTRSNFQNCLVAARAKREAPEHGA